jgi:ribulose-phosphate 3-epimerase
MAHRRLLIAASILSADFRKLEDEIRAVESAGADWIHCDIMDGHFVPNITFGPLVVKAVRKCTTLPIDCHLMIANASGHIESFRDAGADNITVHAEACADLPSVLGRIRASGAKAGVCVNPNKPIDMFLPHLDLADLVLIMTVNAGFGGQKFIPESLDKIAATRKEILKRGLDMDLEVDGGINESTVRQVKEKGANIIVAGSFIFQSPNYRERISLLRVP